MDNEKPQKSEPTEWTHFASSEIAIHLEQLYSWVVHRDISNFTEEDKEFINKIKFEHKVQHIVRNAEYSFNINKTKEKYEYAVAAGLESVFDDIITLVKNIQETKLDKKYHGTLETYIRILKHQRKNEFLKKYFINIDFLLEKLYRYLYLMDCYWRDYTSEPPMSWDDYKTLIVNKDKELYDTKNCNVFDFFYIAGFSFYDGICYLKELQKGMGLILVPEPENEHDEYAVALYYGETKLGYVPKSKNKNVVKLFYSGEYQNYKVIINKINYDDSLERTVQVIILKND